MARNALSRAARCWLRRPVPPPGSRGLQPGVSRALFLLDVILSTRVSKCPPLPLVDSESCWPCGEPAELTRPELDPALLPPNAVSANARPRGYPAATLHFHGLARTARHVLSYLPYTHLPYSSRTDRKKAHPAPSSTPRPQKCTSAGLPCRDLPCRLLPSLLPHASHARARFCSPTLQEPRRRTPQPPTPYPRVSRLPCSAYLAISCPPTPCGPLALHMHAREANAYPTGVPARSRGLPCSPRSRNLLLTPPLQPQQHAAEASPLCHHVRLCRPTLHASTAGHSRPRPQYVSTAAAAPATTPLTQPAPRRAVMSEKSRRRRAYPQQIVTTRLLYCLQDPFAQLSRLQRI